MCISMGGSVPFILRKSKKAELDKARVELVKTNLVHWRNVLRWTDVF